MDAKTEKTLLNEESSEQLFEALQKLGVSEIGPEVLSQAVLGESLLDETQSIIDEKLIH